MKCLQEIAKGIVQPVERLEIEAALTMAYVLQVVGAKAAHHGQPLLEHLLAIVGQHWP